MSKKTIVVEKQKPCCNDKLCSRCGGKGYYVIKTTKRKAR